MEKWVGPLVFILAVLASFYVVACFSHNLFGDPGPTITYPGVDPNAPIPPMTPSENDSPAITRWKRIVDSGVDGNNSGVSHER
jgi:hypothetical protein